MMVPGRFGRLVLRRRPFWIYVAILMAFKIALVFVMSVAPQSFDYLKHADTWLVMALAYVVGARFADVRWPRWLGITSVIVIALIFPFVLLVLRPSSPNLQSENPIDRVPDLAWLSSVALVILLVTVGVKRSSAEQPPGDSAARAPTPGT
jgi:hypothetical protein